MKANTLAESGQGIVDAAKAVGNKIVGGAECAVDAVKNMTGLGGCAEGTNVGLPGIKEHMHVIASCGKKVGVVDHVQGEAIQLTKNDSPDGVHHFIPKAWVDHVDSHVHLTKNSKEAESQWKPDATSCGCG